MAAASAFGFPAAGAACLPQFFTELSEDGLPIVSVLPLQHHNAAAKAFSNAAGSCSRLDAVAVGHPPAYLGGQGSSSSASAAAESAVSTGTTLVAVSFPGGVVLAADTRTSAGGFVVNRAARKISMLHEKIFVCRSGSAADTQALTQIVKLYVQQYAQELPRLSPAAAAQKRKWKAAAAEREKKEEESAATEEEASTRRLWSLRGSSSAAADVDSSRSSRTKEDASTSCSCSILATPWAVEEARCSPQVAAAATLFHSLCYEYKEALTAAVLVAGVDALNGAQIFSLPLGGAKVQVKYAAGGSGSVYLSALMDAHYREDFTKCEAIDFAKRCVAHAISRDGSSGGMIRLVIITHEGVSELCVEGDQLPFNIQP